MQSNPSSSRAPAADKTRAWRMSAPTACCRSWPPNTCWRFERPSGRVEPSCVTSSPRRRHLNQPSPDQAGHNRPPHSTLGHITKKRILRQRPVQPFGRSFLCVASLITAISSLSQRANPATRGGVGARQFLKAIFLLGSTRRLSATDCG